METNKGKNSLPVSFLVPQLLAEKHLAEKHLAEKLFGQQFNKPTVSILSEMSIVQMFVSLKFFGKCPLPNFELAKCLLVTCLLAICLLARGFSAKCLLPNNDSWPIVRWPIVVLLKVSWPWVSQPNVCHPISSWPYVCWL